METITITDKMIEYVVLLIKSNDFFLRISI